MRACQPVGDGYVERGGVKLHYEVFGTGEPAVVLLPTWSIIHSRHWKMQVPDLARRHRVVTFDGRGNGRSDRPVGVEAYRPTEFAADALAVMDATGIDRAVLVALSAGAMWALELGVLHPERVAGIVFVGPALPLTPVPLARATHSFTERLATTEGWAKYNQHYWREHYREFLEFFFGAMFNEAHSTKPIEDAVGWGLETDPETLIATNLAREEAARQRRHARRAERRAARHDRRRRPWPARARPGPFQPAAPGIHRIAGAGARAPAADPHLDPVAAAQPQGAVHLLPDRARPRPPRRGHRQGAAGPAPRPQDRLAGPG